MPRHSAATAGVGRAVLSREALRVGGSHFAKAIGCDVRESLMDMPARPAPALNDCHVERSRDISEYLEIARSEPR